MRGNSRLLRPWLKGRRGALARQKPWPGRYLQWLETKLLELKWVRTAELVFFASALTLSGRTLLHHHLRIRNWRELISGASSCASRASP